MGAVESVELVQHTAENLQSRLHDRQSAVLIVSMVDTRVTIATHLQPDNILLIAMSRGEPCCQGESCYLDVKTGSLEVSHERQAATNGVWFAVSQHLLGCFIQSVEPQGVKVTGYPLHGERERTWREERD